MLLPLVLVSDLLIPHLLLKLDLPLVFLSLLALPLVIELALLLLQPEVLILLLLLRSLLPAFLLQLLVQLFLNLLLELFLPHPFQLLLFLEEFSVEFYQRCPLIVVVALHMVDAF